MEIIILQHDDETIITNKEELTKEFHEIYEKNGNGMDKDEFYYEFFCRDAINGEIAYSSKDDCIEFEYADWDTKLTYWHIELCIEWLQKEEKSEFFSSFNKHTMFHVLMALNSCGAIGKREYEALNNKYCSY